MMSKKQTKYEAYEKKTKEHEPKRPIFLNCCKAFLIGGFICFIGQCIATFYIHYFDFTEQTVGNPTVATLIIITMFLTGFCIYEKIAQFAGAGYSVSLTIFANSVISFVIIYRLEDLL